MNPQIKKELELLSKNANELADKLEAMAKYFESQQTVNPTPKPTPKKLKIILAAGHGGMKDGKYMTNPVDGKKYTFTDVTPNETAYEGVINRQIADKFYNLALAQKFRIYKVYHNWRDMPLPEITRMENSIVSALGNDEPSIYLSIHHNAHGNQDKGQSLNPNGWCAFVYKNPKTGVISQKGYEYASVIERHIRKMVSEKGFNMKFRDLGDFAKQKQAIWTNSTFWELRKTKSPSVLVEGGFFTNYNDFKLISSEDWQNAKAQALLDACIEIDSKL